MKDYSRNFDNALLNLIIPFVQEVSDTITNVGVTRHKRDQALKHLLNKFEKEIQAEANAWIFNNIFIIDRVRYTSPPLAVVSTTHLKPFKISLN